MVRTVRNVATAGGSKGGPMSTSMPNAPSVSNVPNAPDERRIIPLRPAALSNPPVQQGETLGTNEPGEPPRAREDAARHYLKFMLPSIPIATFVLSFVYWYLILGMRLVRPEHVAARVPDGAALVDPTLPLVGALLVALTTTVLCMTIYFGFLRICALRRSDQLNQLERL